ncbi:MAG: hypothetical protein ACOCTP_03790 [Roseicyclus sp.]
MRRRSLPIASILLICAASAGAFPLDGSYFSSCAGEGEAAEGATELTLAFPEVCVAGTCCALSNPTRLRGLPDQFLYDAACSGEGRDFDARIFFGQGPDATSVVIVLESRAWTLGTCASEPPPEDA